MVLSASLICSLVLANSTADTGNENCTYDGLRLDKGSMPNTKGKVNSVPDDFSGFVVCVDPDTKHVYEEYQLVKGERVGSTKQYDRRTGRLAEVIPYEAGKRQGCVKRYDSKTGRLVFEFCVDAGEPHGLQKSFDADSGNLTSIKWVKKRGETGEATSVQFNSKGQPTSLQCGPQTVLGSDDVWCGRGGRSGEVTLYSSEGWPTAVVSYRNNKQHGWERRYHKDGHLMREERFEDGKSVEERAVDGKGTSYERTKTGESENETVYFEESKKPRLVIERKKGQLVKEIAYFANGKVNYEKVAKGEGVALHTYTEAGQLESEGTYRQRWGDGIGLWGLLATGELKRYANGALVEELHFNEASELDGLQKLFDRENPKRVARREKWEKNVLRWSEDTTKSGDVLRREYAEDGSVKVESLTKAAREL